jgi:hypothetical protein
MFGLARTFSVITACMVATPAVAQAPPPPTTAFDGTYIGVSRTLEGTMLGYSTRQCPPSGRVAPLTIVNGTARTKALGTAEGSVNPQGVLVMRALAGFAAGSRFEGQIDGQGTVTGRFTASCSYKVVWQKKGQ